MRDRQDPRLRRRWVNAGGMKRIKAQNHGEQRVLQLMLKHEYFAKILEGKKSYEFLDLTNYWKSRTRRAGVRCNPVQVRLSSRRSRNANTWDANGGAIITRSSSERLLS